MKATEYKEITQVLGLFASARETASLPEAAIGVQVSEGKAKLIAGKAPAGAIVTLDGTFPGKYAYTVDARPFLQSAKVITGKQEVTIDIDEKGVTIRTSEGGKILLKADGRLLEAGFPKKPKRFTVRSTVNGPAFKQLAKVFDAIVGDSEIDPPQVVIDGDTSHFVAVMPTEKKAMYATLRVNTERLGPEPPDYHDAAYSVFWRSLKHFEADGLIEWGDDGVYGLSGLYELYVTPYRVSPYNPKTKKSEPPRAPDAWPIMALKGEPSVEVTVDKKPLIEAIKGVMPNDEHGRVTLSVKEGLLNVAPWGTPGGMTIPADTKHEGHRSVNAEYLLKLLRAMDGKRVTIGWAQQPAMILSAPEMPDWTILLAPVAMDG